MSWASCRGADKKGSTEKHADARAAAKSLALAESYAMKRD